jgi:integrase
MNSITLSGFDLSAIDRARLADGTRRHYKQAVRDMMDAGIDIFNRIEVIEYSKDLPHSRRSNLKAALSIILDGYMDEAKLSDKPIETIQRFIWFVEVMKKSLTVEKPTTKRNPHWLSQEQIDTITAAALSHSARDHIVISLLCNGLRCEEAAELTFDSLTELPHPDGVKNIITVIGKGDKKRDVPIHANFAKHLREWKSTAQGGRVARRFYRGGKLGDSLDTSRIFRMVRRYGELLGIEDLDPHDLRRSYGRIMYYANGRDIMLVMMLLGHNDVKITQRYIGLKGALDVDVLPIGGLQIAGD